MKVTIIGSGLAGATAAAALHDAGADVRVLEQSPVWGGQLRTEHAGGILYEPHGAHILHTTDRQVWDFVTDRVEMLPYRHRVMTEVDDRVLSWPPQISELEQLPQWADIRRELDQCPRTPRTTNFETWCEDIMGPTLYALFIRPYTIKQWGTDPRELAAQWAPKRIELRVDGYRDLFRDPYQGWPRGGYLTLIDALLGGVPVELGAPVDAENVAERTRGADAVVLTAPLDVFFRHALGELPWRGVRLESHFIPGADHVLPCGVVNHPGLDQTYTRRIETKWMSGQTREGTVVSYEYPGAPARHYPVDDVEGKNRGLAHDYRALVAQELGPRVHLAGRLATYTYIDMDQAIRQGLNAAARILKQTDTGAKARS
ncbi:UDP-galactopyranose mutase [Streptomyces sp. NPDC091279]|uniref:UDP-galactopyranose mutase n=1 Tax=unclassified Streptomyces TaxID=2593676 RepID=UPI0037F4AA5D